MLEWAGATMDTLWHNGLAAIPLVLFAAAASRLLPCLPATRHLIWVTVLIWLVGSSVLPQSPVGTFGTPASIDSSVAPKVEPVAVPIETKKNNPQPVTARPRNLSSRLAKRDATSSARSGRTERSEGSDERYFAPLSMTDAKTSRMSSTPPPRYAARAEIPAPDKLARAQEAAGPRSQSGFEYTTRAPKVNSNARDHSIIPPIAAHQPLAPSTTNTLASAPQANKPEIKVAPLPSPPLVSGEAKTVGSPELKFAAPWKEWTSALLGVRNAVSQLPPIPQNVWLGGTGLLLLLAGARVLSFHRRLNHAKPASREVRAVVASACQTLGLRRVPQILMVDGRLSPMVWCGVTPKLILPVSLWEQLDDLGRKAVVYHELAHVRRLDHRTAWIESAIGMLYWWHPLVWWVRGRLHAEAENCCDAWVMTLLPKRRAYATALLKTREYLSGGDGLPAMGIGITPGRARLFARRLTMVMTESVRPKLSASGISLVMLVAVCGWIAAPARSCPKDAEAAAKAGGKAPCAAVKSEGGETSAPCSNSKEHATPTPRAKSMGGKELTGRPSTALLVGQPLPTPAPIAGTVIAVPAPAQPAPAGIVQVSDRDGARAKRVAELQAELARLERKIETLSEALEEQDKADDGDDDDGHEHAHGHADDSDDDDDDAPRTPRPPMPPRTPRAAQAPRAGQPAMPPIPPMPPMPPMPAMPPMPPMAGLHGDGPGHTAMPMPRSGQSWADVSGEKTSWRTYKLAKGKAEDFFKFMSRSDIPIWVRSNDEGIDIQASPRQHEIFDAFFRMVDPSEDRGPRASFFGQNAPMLAYAEAMGMGCDHGCKGNCPRCRQAAELRAMADEVRTRARAEALELRAKAHGEGERVRAQAREEAEKARTRMRRHARDARSEARDQHETIEELERQSQQLAEVADSYREQAERIGERAQSVNERVEKDSEMAASADAYRTHVESLERSAEELNRQAQELQRQVETMERRAREMEENARQMEHHADELDQRADAVREAADSLESGVQPTPELVESVLALVSGIENMIPTDAKEAIEDAISASTDDPEDAADDEPADVEVEDEPAIEGMAIPVINLGNAPSDSPVVIEPDEDESK